MAKNRRGARLGRKIIALCLTVIMISTMLPVGVFAEDFNLGGGSYDTELVKALQSVAGDYNAYAILDTLRAVGLVKDNGMPKDTETISVLKSGEEEPSALTLTELSTAVAEMNDEDSIVVEGQTFSKAQITELLNMGEEIAALAAIKSEISQVNEYNVENLLSLLQAMSEGDYNLTNSAYLAQYTLPEDTSEVGALTVTGAEGEKGYTGAYAGEGGYSDSHKFTLIKQDCDMWYTVPATSGSGLLTDVQVTFGIDATTVDQNGAVTVTATLNKAQNGAVTAQVRLVNGSWTQAAIADSVTELVWEANTTELEKPSPSISAAARRYSAAPRAS